MNRAPIGEQQLEEIAHILAPIINELAFVGGAILFTYLPTAKTLQLRPTYDLDAVIQLVGYSELETLNKQLKNIGFYPDPESNVICRYTNGTFTLDVMPTDTSILGFSNKWYQTGLINKEWYVLSSSIKIPRFTLDYYLASKWEDTKNRGGSDLRFSKDMEDITTILSKIDINEITESENDVTEYLKSAFRDFLNHNYAEEIILAHLPGIEKLNLEAILSTINDFISE